MLLAMASCSTVEDANQLADRQERTDIIITGDLQMENFFQNAEGDASEDLVAFNYYGNPSPNFDYKIQLEQGNTLIIQVYDAQHLNPWEQVNLPYNIYPGQDLDDKLFYTNIVFSDATGTCTYSTNFNNNIPPGIFLDVFKVIQNDGQQIQCRIRDMILYKTNDPSRTITINGTFVGALTFE
jgi:hypothetical protein